MNNYAEAIIAFFQVVGISQPLTKITPLFEYILIGWAFVNMMILTVIGITVTYYSKHVFFDNDAIGALTDIIQLAAPFLAQYIIIIESMLTKRMRVTIWQTFAKIDGSLLSIKMNINVLRKMGLKRYLIKAIATQLICMATEIRIMTYIGPNREWSYHWYASIYTFVVCRSQHLFYIFFIEMLKMRMECVNAELTNLNKIRFNKKYSDNVKCKRLAILKNVHSSLWHCSVMINKSFGWSQLTNVTANFVCLSVNLYWNYAALYFGSNPFWKESLMGSLPLIIILVVLCYSCEECQNTVSLVY